MVLLDWTRMGRQYCLAGVIHQDGQVRVVRPLPARNRHCDVPNVGWSPYLMDGRARWDILELVRPEPGPGRAPHTEDIWVQDLRPRRASATPAQRRAILQATITPVEQPLFGTALKPTRTAAFLEPGAGSRSLAGAVFATKQIVFSAVWRDGAAEPDFRVTLPVPSLGERVLPVKDHFLLRQAEIAGEGDEAQVNALMRAVRQMGEQVVVRLGLSRPYPPGQADASCWLMADGFFSLTDPQP
jgi:hypothetical protein